MWSDIKDFIYYNKGKIMFVIFIIVLATGYVFASGNIIDFNEIITNTNTSEIVKEEEYEELGLDITESKSKIYVDIKGEIKKSGVYEASINDRVIDVINLAGGLTKNADVSLINLSKKVTDEMVILIYSKEEVKNKKENQLQDLMKNDAAYDVDNSVSDDKISINTATLSELMTISGVGEAKAKAIIDYRSKNGKFNSLEDLLNVSGIGNSIFEKIKDYIKL